MLETTLDRAAPTRFPGGVFASPSPVLPRITVLGGGNGLAVLLQGLREARFPDPVRNASDLERLTAIVTVADDGGSSGVLRREFNILAPGDIRNCLLALSDADPTLQDLFNFRFDGKAGGHSLGNLMLTALALLERDFGKAVEKAAKLLAVRGRVLPATLDDVQLLAEFADGSRCMGESGITAARRRIRRISLVPPGTRALPQALSAISGSDLVVIGPGSLYTSLIPVVLVRGIAHSIAESGARVALVMNLMTEPGETDGYSAGDVLAALRKHAPDLPIHDVLLNSEQLPDGQMQRYAAEGATPIVTDLLSITRQGCRAVERDLLGAGPKVRHSPHKLARALLDLVAKDTP